jgi:hypothetical protein
MALSAQQGGFYHDKVKNVGDKILDAKTCNSLKQEYIDMNRDYEVRKFSGTETQRDRLDYVQRNSSFSKGIVRQIVDFQIESSLKKAEKSSEEGRTFKKVHDGVQNVVKGSMAVDFTPEIKFGTRTNLREQAAQFWSETPLAKISVDVDLAAEWLRKSFLSDSSTRSDDRYRVNASRSIPVLDLNASVDYGLETTKMRSSVSRQIVKNLSAELAQTRGFDSQKSQNSKREETVTLNYGFRF